MSERYVPDPLFGNFSPPRPESSDGNCPVLPDLSGSSRPNEPDNVRRQRVADEDMDDESNFFYSRYEPTSNGGHRRFQVDERRTVGEVLSDMELDGYQYAFIKHDEETYLLRRQGCDYNEERHGPRHVQQGRIFVLTDYASDSESILSMSRTLRSEREGPRRLAEVRAFFINDENPVFRGRKLLDAERKL